MLLLQSWPDQLGLRSCRGRELRTLTRRVWTGQYGVNFWSPLNPKAQGGLWTLTQGNLYTDDTEYLLSFWGCNNDIAAMLKMVMSFCF